MDEYQVRPVGPPPPSGDAPAGPCKTSNAKVLLIVAGGITPLLLLLGLGLWLDQVSKGHAERAESDFVVIREGLRIYHQEHGSLLVPTGSEPKAFTLTDPDTYEQTEVMQYTAFGDSSMGALRLRHVVNQAALNNPMNSYDLIVRGSGECIVRHKKAELQMKISHMTEDKVVFAVEKYKEKH